MSKRHAVCLVGALVTLSGSALAAEGPIPAGTIGLGAERLSGFFHTSHTQSAGGVDFDTTVNRFTLLSMAPTQPAEIPRIGFDYFVIDGLSIGGTLSFAYSSADASAPLGAGGLALTAGASSTTFLIAPRVGYGFMFTDSIGFWPRGGFFYTHTSLSRDQSPDASIYYAGLGLDAPFIFSMTPGFALTAGPLLEFAFAGSASQDGAPSSTDLSYFTFGLSVGLLGLI